MFFPIMVLLWLRSACRYVVSFPDVIQWGKTAKGTGCCVRRGVAGYSWGRVVWVEVEFRGDGHVEALGAVRYGVEKYSSPRFPLLGWGRSEFAKNCAFFFSLYKKRKP